MNDEHREGLRALLEQSARELRELQAVPSPNAPRQMDKCALDRPARMDLLQAQRVAEDTARRRRQRLREVRKALQRIDSGDYGYCVVCGEAIDLRRLQAERAAQHCIECAGHE
jgi:DnaK suppressor protein